MKGSVRGAGMMMDIGHIATLAHLDLTKSESRRFSKDLREILDAFKTLDAVDTSKVKPAFHPIPLKNLLRDDVPHDSEMDPFSNTNLSENGYFKGPKIQ